MDTSKHWPAIADGIPARPLIRSTTTADYAMFAVMVGARIAQTLIVLWPVWS